MVGMLENQVLLPVLTHQSLYFAQNPSVGFSYFTCKNNDKSDVCQIGSYEKQDRINKRNKKN